MVIVKYMSASCTPSNFIGKMYGLRRVYFIRNNQIHRYYGPAEIWHDGCKSWYFYRYYGPSYINVKTKYKAWYFNDMYYLSSLAGYNQKQFLKDLNKQWLL